MILDKVAKYKRQPHVLRTRTANEEVLLRPVAPEDAAWMAETDWTDLPAWQRIIQKSIDDAATILFVIASTDQPFGQAMLFSIDEGGCACYNRILRMVHGVAKGGMTVAVREINRFGFEEIGLSRISLSQFADDERAGKLYDACGFIAVGDDVPMERSPDGGHDTFESSRTATGAALSSMSIVDSFRDSERRSRLRRVEVGEARPVSPGRTRSGSFPSHSCIVLLGTCPSRWVECKLVLATRDDCQAFSRFLYAATRSYAWCSPPSTGLDASLVGPMTSGASYGIGVSPASP